MEIPPLQGLLADASQLKAFFSLAPWSPAQLQRYAQALDWQCTLSGPVGDPLASARRMGAPPQEGIEALQRLYQTMATEALAHAGAATLWPQQSAGQGCRDVLQRKAYAQVSGMYPQYRNLLCDSPTSLQSINDALQQTPLWAAPAPVALWYVGNPVTRIFW